jgi:hypothetical protein
MRGLDSDVLLQLPRILKGPFLIGSRYLNVGATLVHMMVDGGTVDDGTRETGTLTAPYRTCLDTECFIDTPCSSLG